MILLFSSVLHFFFVENIQNYQFFWKNWLVNEIWTAMGRELLEISKKNYFHFKARQKMVTKFGKFKKLKWREGSQLCKLSQLCKHFLKMKIIFFDILSHSPPIAVRNSLTNQFFHKKLPILYIFNKKRSAKLKRKEGYRKNFFFFFFNI